MMIADHDRDFLVTGEARFLKKKKKKKKKKKMARPIGPNWPKLGPK